MEFLQGILCGLAISLLFSFGPTFFSELQTCINHGFKRSFPFAFGINLGDIIIVGSLLTVLRDFDMNAVMHNPYVAIIGGIAIAAVGIHTFRRKAQVAADNSKGIQFSTNSPSPIRIYLKGFCVNLFNPMIWIYWISVIAVLSGSRDMPTNQMYLFFGGILFATLSMDIIKCKLASLLRRIITVRVLGIINKVIGSFLFLFATYLVVSMFIYQKNPPQEEEKSTSAAFIEKMMSKKEATKDTTTAVE